MPVRLGRVTGRAGEPQERPYPEGPSTQLLSLGVQDAGPGLLLLEPISQDS